MSFGDQIGQVTALTGAMQVAAQQAVYLNAQMQKATTQTYTSTDGNGKAVGFGGVAAGDLLTQFENYIAAKDAGDVQGEVQLRAFLQTFGANLFGGAGPSGARVASLDEFEQAWRADQKQKQLQGNTLQKGVDAIASKDCGAEVAPVVHASSALVIGAQKKEAEKIEHDLDGLSDAQRNEVARSEERIKKAIEGGKQSEIAAARQDLAALMTKIRIENDSIVSTLSKDLTELGVKQKKLSMQETERKFEIEDAQDEITALDKSISEKQKERERLKNAPGDAERRAEIVNLQLRRAADTQLIEQLQHEIEELTKSEQAIRRREERERFALEKRQMELTEREQDAIAKDERREGSIANNVNKILGIVTATARTTTAPSVAQQARAVRLDFLTGRKR